MLSSVSLLGIKMPIRLDLLFRRHRYSSKLSLAAIIRRKPSGDACKVETSNFWGRSRQGGMICLIVDKDRRSATRSGGRSEQMRLP